MSVDDKGNREMRLACIVLAAGEGKRMHSAAPKVLHKLCGRPMLQFVLDTVEELKPERKIVVVGRHGMEIERAIAGEGVSLVLQKEPKGTGDALLSAREALGKFRGAVLVLNGDMPLITPETLKRFLGLFRRHGDALSVLSFPACNPSSYGRIIRDGSGRALKIVEEKDATDEEKGICEVNSGVYGMESGILPLLQKITMNVAKGEYYLTDLFEIVVKDNLGAGSYCIGTEDELMGVNTRFELLRAEAVILQRIARGLIDSGVNVFDTSSLYIHYGVSVGTETVLYPNIYLEGATTVGRGCTIYPNVRIINSTICDGALIKDSSVIEDSTVGEGAEVGPFSHLRPGSTIGPRAKIGNFVEVKKSVIGERTKASHLSYIGDAVVGKGVNIGAGTITCNYDGDRKHQTIIEDGVFIGSDTQIVAPIRIGKEAYVGAGSTVTKDVPPRSLAVSRTRQKNIEGWAAGRKSKREGVKSEDERGD
jgi:bifunctional UDP-N-acetylglucosamine pyrophosphorylase / glucosamine-1-phosphate N-acetyltransferase